MRRNPKIVSLSPPMQAAAGITPNHGFSLQSAWELVEQEPELRAAFTDFDDFDNRHFAQGSYAAVFSFDEEGYKVLKLTTDEDDAAAARLVMRGKVRVPRNLPRPRIGKDGSVDGLARIYAVYELGTIFEEVQSQVVARRGALEREGMLYGIVAETLTEERRPMMEQRVLHDVQRARLAFLAAIKTHHSVDEVARDQRLTGEQRRLFDAMVNGFQFLLLGGFEITDFHAANWGWSTERQQSVLLDFGHHKEHTTENPETGGSFGGQAWNDLEANPTRMPRVRRAFEQVFALVKESFPDFGAIELHQDEKAGADNGVGAERQFGYCMSGDPQVIAFAAKTERLPEANILGLMAHEFGHALDNRYGKKLPGMLGVRLPAGAELRADAIAKAAFGKTIRYDAHDVQCIGCRGTAPRPRRLGA